MGNESRWRAGGSLISPAAGGADLPAGKHTGSMRLGGTGYADAFTACSATGGDVFVGGSFTGFSEFGGAALAATNSNGTDGLALLLMPLN